MAKFFFFEKIVQVFYTHVFTEPKETYSKPTQLGITFGSGYLSGIICAIVSHPADSLVSQLGKPQNKGKSLGAIVNEVGFGTLATRGLGTRVIMIGTLTGNVFPFNPTNVITDVFLACRLPMVDL
jgi:solute carrier family 25 phosphate transporter 3